VWNGDGAANEDGGGAHTALGAAGSGCSTLYRARRFQYSVAGYAGLGCGLRRSSVDVAAVADPATGYSVYQTYPARTGSWGVAGGTSLSSPLVAAMWALAGGSGGTRYPALSLYGHLAARVKHAHDVTLGGTGLCGGASIAECRQAWGTNPNVTAHGLVDCAFPAKGTGVLANRYQCNARRGYDGVAGVGTPASASLFTALTPSVHVTWPAGARRNVTKRFAVRATDPFPGGRIVRYTWHWGDGKVTHTTSARTAHRFRSDGRFLVQVKAVDNYGQSRIVGHHLKVTG
jgi:subtilase family serine protease